MKSGRAWAAALLAGVGVVLAPAIAAAQQDTFFEELERAEGAAAPAAPVASPAAPADRAKPVALTPAAPAPAVPTKAPAASPLAPPVTSAAVPALPQAAQARTSPPRDPLDPEPDKPVAAPAPAAPADPLDHPTPAAAAPAAEPLPPLHAALKAALDRREAAEGRVTRERRKERDAVAFFYAAHGFAPIWSRDGQPAAAVAGVLVTLAHAGDDALAIAAPPSGVTAAGSPDAVAASELALTEAVVSYARQATGSRVDPQAISPLIGRRPALADPAEVLDELMAAGAAAGARLQALNPTEPRYAALRARLAELHAARLPGAGPAIPPGPTLRLGMRDERVPLLRQRFHLDPPAAALPGRPADALRYDAAVTEAVAAFQRGHDLPPSGALTAATVDALGGGHAGRAEGVITANMEMWRWMPRDLGANRIEVNVPDYAVTVFRDGRPVATHRVVVGKTDTPTPLFSNTMKYLIVNPYWNVPQSIIRTEMLPKAGGDLSYLADRGYSVGWRGGEWVVKQLPGEKNALGRIKFLFPNDYAVYLHDTPAKALFSAPRRAFSHGCVRVDKPFAFAEAVLNDAVPDTGRRAWSEDRLENMIGEKERYVNLPAALPIHIAYFTASVDGGTLKLREDVYGYARAVAAALGQPAVEPVVERKAHVAAHTTAPVAERVRRAPVVSPMMVDDLDPR